MPFFVDRYTNDINPFGDSNLTEQFVWGKKREKEGTANQQLSKRDLREMQKKNVDEIEKVGFRRVYDRAAAIFVVVPLWTCSDGTLDQIVTSRCAYCSVCPRNAEVRPER